MTEKADWQGVVQAADEALARGEPLIAYDLCSEALSGNPAPVARGLLRQRLALALARSGATDRALALARGLIDEGICDAETIGLLARLHKDLWLADSGGGAGRAFASESLRLYVAAHAAGGGPWPLVNAATIAFVLGDREAARQHAGDALRLLHETPAAQRDHWWHASLAEASLVLDDAAQARRSYAVANAAGPGIVAAARRNARLVLRARGDAEAELDALLPRPALAVFAGHLPDLPGRAAARFPEAAAPAVAEALRQRLADGRVAIGYAAAAGGGDLLFHEALHALGAESIVVLPRAVGDFIEESVAPWPAHWRHRFDAVLGRASRVIVHSPTGCGPAGHDFNNRMLLGLARIRARSIDGIVNALALWDGQPGSEGGTASAAVLWAAAGEKVECLDPRACRWSRHRSGVRDLPNTPGGRRIASLLFADAVGFSRLPDDAIPAFVRSYLGLAAQLVDVHEAQVLERNTWGDGLYVCFSSAAAGGAFAIALNERMRNADWAALGLPAELAVRIALHAGPVHEFYDPVTRRTGYGGIHVSRAARLEPVTPPGEVYASETYAAMCAFEGVEELHCEYVGRLPLAKRYGEFAAYRVAAAFAQTSR